MGLPNSNRPSTEHNRPDVVVLDKIERSCNVIDIACPFDTRGNGKIPGIKRRDWENLELPK